MPTLTRPRTLHGKSCDDYPESACALLLCLTHKLETLYMHLPAWNAGEYDALVTFFRG